VTGTTNNSQWPLRYDLLLRYRVIEIIALWEGRLTTNHLCNTFGIGRQQASKDINLYNQDVAPGNLVYDKYLKGYKPTENFRPRVTTGTADEYLYLLNRNNTLSSTFESLNLNYANTEVLQVPIRDITPTILRPIVQAARSGKRVEVEYVSLSSPEKEIRVIAPHTLVHTGMRWHVRAYCEKRKQFLDFVLSRFRGEPDIMDDSPNTIDDDDAWHLKVEIHLKPDSRLNKAQQAIIARDFGMTRQSLRIKTRAAFVTYALHLLQIDPNKVETRPEAQQIVVENLDDIRQWIYQ
jgi:predicted DNA-binding transcriptional regulator YafY